MNFHQYQYNNKNITFHKAIAQIFGGPLAPDIHGIVTFTEVAGGIEVSIEVEGLPPYEPATRENPPIGPFGFHIHENGTCSVEDFFNPFTSAGGHWNPTNQPHGFHAGDFPVLISNDGYSKMSFFTNKFQVSQIIGKAVVIHQNPDDYRTQPSGMSGKRLACGIIQGMVY